MRRPLATLPTVAFLAIALGATARLEACSCTNDPTLEEQVASASMVFSGLVTDIQPMQFYVDRAQAPTRFALPRRAVPTRRSTGAAAPARWRRTGTGAD